MQMEDKDKAHQDKDKVPNSNSSQIEEMSGDIWARIVVVTRDKTVVESRNNM